MTTPQERRAYYDLALELAAKGEIVELGTWLGASTVFLAAGVRDSSAGARVHSYDRFVWQAIHEYKAGVPLTRSMIDQVRVNLGPLYSRVKLHAGEILAQRWSGEIGLLVADGPKRVHEIVPTLKEFGRHVVAGGCMAWQDFAYFPAYDIPACLDRLEQAGRIEFVDSVFPGTTAIFRVVKPLTAADVDPGQFALKRWTPDEIVATWERWRDRLAEGMRPRWMCGAAMFLCDRGATDRGVRLFRSLLAEHRPAIAPKWEYLKEKRPTMAAKYSALVRALDHV
jgi:hypothetical protein